jgi:hypothetical protein
VRNGTDLVGDLGRSYLREREVIAQAQMSLHMTSNARACPNALDTQLHIVHVRRLEANAVRSTRPHRIDAGQRRRRGRFSGACTDIRSRGSRFPCLSSAAFVGRLCHIKPSLRCRFLADSVLLGDERKF